jgi:hypothetical protein
MKLNPIAQLFGNTYALPEIKVKHVPKTPYVPKPVGEADYKALKLLASVDGPPAAIRQMERVMDKAWKKRALVIPESETDEQKWWRCEARFHLGYYEDWSGWEFRDPFATMIWYQNPFKVPVWDLQPVDKLYVVGEQGLGDEIMFSQAILKIKHLCKEIVVETQPRLQPIFERSLGVKTAPSKMNKDGRRYKQDFEADAWVTMGELCRVHMKGRESFDRKPYISADPKRVEDFKAFQGKVGISWRGRQGELKELLALFPGAVSLQYDQEWDEDVERPDLDLKDDLEGVLGLIANLDRVVTVSTSVAHFASAMGIKTDVIIADPKTGRMGGLIPWKWINLKSEGETWWYPKTTRTFRNIKAYLA